MTTIELFREGKFLEVNYETLVNYTVNKENKFINVDYINKLFEKYDIRNKKTNELITSNEKHIETYIKAMTHQSYMEIDMNNKNIGKEYAFILDVEWEPDDKNDCMNLLSFDYDREEFLGDAYIRVILAKYLYLRFPNANSGWLSKNKSKLESTNALATIAYAIGLNEYMIISKYYEMRDCRKKDEKKLEDTFEAFIGALYIEFGFEILEEFLLKLIEYELDLPEIISTDENYKEMLGNYFHSQKWPSPKWELLEEGSGDKKLYVMAAVDNNGQYIGVGNGLSKKKAEQMASKQACINYGILNSELNYLPKYCPEYD